MIRVLKDDIQSWRTHPAKPNARRTIACLQRAIAIVRLWDANITPADVRAAERKRKGAK